MQDIYTECGNKIHIHHQVTSNLNLTEISMGLLHKAFDNIMHNADVI